MMYGRTDFFNKNTLTMSDKSMFEIRYQVVSSIDEITEKNVEIHDAVFNDTRRLFYERDDIINLKFVNCKAIGECERMFAEMSNLESLDLTGLDVSEVTDMEGMFESDEKLLHINFGTFDTSHVFNMSSMFCGCSMTELELHFNTYYVENMCAMFSSMNNLKKLDISSFDTSIVRNMEALFRGCEKLQCLDLSNFDTSKVRSMESMFAHMYELKHLNISSFNTSNVHNMCRMFCKCKSLKELDINHFDISNVNNMRCMFKNCYALQKLSMQKVPNGCNHRKMFANTFKEATLRYMFGEFDAIVECTDFHNNEFITLRFDIKVNDKHYPDISWELITYTNIIAYKLKTTNSAFDWRDKDGIYYGWTAVLYKTDGFDINATSIIKEIWNERDMRLDIFKISKIEIDNACDFYSTDGKLVSYEYVKNNRGQQYIIKLKDTDYKTIAENDLFAHKIIEGNAVNYCQIDDFINTWYYENPATK